MKVCLEVKRFSFLFWVPGALGGVLVFAFVRDYFVGVNPF